MTRVQTLADGPTELDRVWGLRPEYYALFMQDYNKSVARIDPVVLELCRLRVAQMVESDFDQALRFKPAQEAGLSEEKINALTDYPTSELYTERERIILEFTEQWVIQSSSITDNDVARLQTVMSAEGFMYFCKALSVIDQFARANSAFRLALPTVVPPTMSKFSLHAPVAA
jgi:alkylhydroperoxidase family enzyme